MRCTLLASLVAGCAFSADPDAVVPIDCTGLQDGTSCNDRSLCTSGETCRAGACVPAASIACSSLGPCRGEGTCDPATGLCSDPPAIDGTICDDADLCTRADACFGGACTGVPIECAPLDGCHLAGTCDPITGACSNPIAPDGSRCEDGDRCTIRDACSAGSCLTGEPLDCEETQCIAGVCDPSSGVCSGTPIPDGTPCDDLSACTTTDFCEAGRCLGDPVPCEGGPCLIAECDAELGCTIERRPEGASCDDGNACSVGESCFDGTCGGGTAVTCEELDSCHLAGECDPISGCDHPIVPDGTLCNDGDLCTFNDVCTTGLCAGIRVVCEAPTQCHVAGTCDPSTGTCSVFQRPNGDACDDLNACTQADACSTGQCRGAPIPFSGAHCQDGICFADVAVASGITFTSTDNGSLIGGSGGFIDYDGDGLLDVIVGTETGRPRLYRNVGSGFTDVTLQANLPQFFLPDLFMGFAAGDYDNDGDPDLYFLAWGTNILMRNDGGIFTDVTASAGVGDSSWSAAAAFADYDGDGDLDLYVGNYIQIANFPNHTPYPNRLYRNDGGVFTDVAPMLGVAGAGTTLAVTWSDYDGDRDPDLFVCNDFGSTIEPNKLYRNDGGAFTDVSAQTGADIAIYCMGIAPGDFDRDGDIDYYFTNIASNALLENRGPLGFVDVAAATGTELEYDPCYTALYSSSWGTGFADFDRDGFLDLYVSTGWIPAASHIANAFSTPKALYRNVAGVFTDVRRSAGVDDTRIGRAVAFGDYDNDGDVDMFQVNVSGSPRLFRNDAPNPGSHLIVEVTGRASGRDAIGARAIAEIAGASLVREVNPSFSFQSISEKAVHFGLGEASSVDHLRVHYPSGADQDLFEVPADMRIAVTEPSVVVEQAALAPDTVPPGGSAMLSFVLRNMSATPQQVDWSVSGQSGSTSVGGNGSQMISVSVSPAASGAIVVTAGDVAAAVDQARVWITVQ